MSRSEIPSFPVDSRYLVPFDGRFDLARAKTSPPKRVPSREELERTLAEHAKKLAKLQQILFASDRHALLLVFQAMDAAGKDGTIRAVMQGVNPAGCQVYSFKRPSDEELDHDFLWRTARCLPERGRIGIFNRSYYEEVLVVRVHPEYLFRQRLPDRKANRAFWDGRLESIADHEKHLARNGTVIVKFWLNVSRDVQKERFLARIEEPDSNWKFEEGDVAERAHWKEYMHAYEEALRKTSRPWAPWYAIPADDKAFMRVQVSEIIVRTLEKMPLEYPKLDKKERLRLAELRAKLEGER